MNTIWQSLGRPDLPTGEVLREFDPDRWQTKPYAWLVQKNLDADTQLPDPSMYDPAPVTPVVRAAQGSFNPEAHQGPDPIAVMHAASTAEIDSHIQALETQFSPVLDPSELAPSADDMRRELAFAGSTQ